MRRLYGVADNQNRVNMICIELPNGEVVSPKDAIKWIEEQEALANE